jgi:hypothetical protein
MVNLPVARPVAPAPACGAMSRRSYHLNAMFVTHHTSKTEEHDGGAAREQHTVRRSALQGDCKQTPGDCARMPVSRSAARDTRSCFPTGTQSRRPRGEERVGWLRANDQLGAICLLRLITLIEHGSSLAPEWYFVGSIAWPATGKALTSRSWLV